MPTTKLYGYHHGFDIKYRSNWFFDENKSLKMKNKTFMRNHT